MYRIFTGKITLLDNKSIINTVGFLQQTLLEIDCVWTVFTKSSSDHVSSPNSANFTSPLRITFDLKQQILQESDLRSAGRKFILCAWLIVTFNTAAAWGYQRCSSRKHITVTSSSLSYAFLCTVLGWRSFLTFGFFKSVKTPLCYFRKAIHGCRWDNGYSFSAFRTSTVFFAEAWFSSDSSLCC